MPLGEPGLAIRPERQECGPDVHPAQARIGGQALADEAVEEVLQLGIRLDAREEGLGLGRPIRRHQHLGPGRAAPETGREKREPTRAGPLHGR